MLFCKIGKLLYTLIICYNTKNKHKRGVKMFKSKKLLRALSLLIAAIVFISTACSHDSADDNSQLNNEEISSTYESSTTEPLTKTTDENATETIVNSETQSSSITSASTEVQTAATQKTSSKTQNTNPYNTPEKIISYYNECANNVKLNASKVVKNYEKRKVGELKVPQSLQATAESILKSTMKDDTDPIEFTTKEEIKENFIVPTKDYVSTLKISDITDATCKSNGDYYEINIKLKNEKNPVSGKGVGAACDVIEAYEVAQKAPSFLKDFSTYYSNCEISATINKKSGQMIHATYTTPVKLDVTVDLFGTHNATVNFTFIKDYSITY